MDFNPAILLFVAVLASAVGYAIGSLLFFVTTQYDDEDEDE